ncbi:hypothetical protein DMB42_41260 [Nonomuraea sp. WAC 01424]|nr:hypothetical protein DMB42_41260 [Nonomuraea sp. WAC 01424]
MSSYQPSTLSQSEENLCVRSPDLTSHTQVSPSLPLGQSDRNDSPEGEKMSWVPAGSVPIERTSRVALPWASKKRRPRFFSEPKMLTTPSSLPSQPKAVLRTAASSTVTIRAFIVATSTMTKPGYVHVSPDLRSMLSRIFEASCDQPRMLAISGLRTVLIVLRSPDRRSLTMM